MSSPAPWNLWLLIKSWQHCVAGLQQCCHYFCQYTIVVNGSATRGFTTQVNSPLAMNLYIILTFHADCIGIPSPFFLTQEIWWQYSSMGKGMGLLKHSRGNSILLSLKHSKGNPILLSHPDPVRTWMWLRNHSCKDGFNKYLSSHQVEALELKQISFKS